eukprot:RCo046082
MPALVAFGHTWHIGSDDLIWPALGGFVMHLGTVAFIGGIVNIIMQEHCNPAVLALSSCELGLHCCFVLQSFAMIIASGRGTPLQVEKRKAVAPLAYVFVGLCALELLVLIGVTTLLALERRLCESVDEGPQIALVACMWGIHVFRYTIMYILYDSVGHHPRGNVRRWRGRLQLILGSGTPESEHLNIQLSWKLNHTFHGLDMVPSDIVAGLICLHTVEQLQKERPERAHRHPISRPVPMHVVDALRHCSRYCVASYGVSSAKTEFPVIWPWVLRPYFGLREWLFSRGDTVWHAATVQMYTGLPPSAIVDCEMDSKPFQPAYLVAVDHKWRAIVVTFRGTQTGDDMVTSFQTKLTVAELPCLGKLRVLEGFWKAATNSKNRLYTRGALAAAMAANPGYGLVLTGHSMGAAVATLVGLMYRAELRPLCRGVRVYALSLPLLFAKEDLTPAAKTALRELVVGCELDHDVVTRFSFRGMMRWKDRIVRALAYSRQPKWWIFSRAVIALIRKKLRFSNGTPATRLRSRLRQVWPFLINPGGSDPKGHKPGAFAATGAAGSGGCGVTPGSWLWPSTYFGFPGQPSLGAMYSLPPPYPVVPSLCPPMGWGVAVGPELLSLRPAGSQAALVPQDEDVVGTPARVREVWRKFVRPHRTPAPEPDDEDPENDPGPPPPMEEDPEMYSCMNIVHLSMRRVVTKKLCFTSETREFKAVWEEPGDYVDLITSEHMLDDHRMFSIQKALFAVSDVS